MIILLDTTVLIDVLRNRKNRRAMLANLVEQGHTLAISAINVGELYAGMRSSEAPQTQTFLNQLHCYPITSDLAKLAGSLVQAYSQKGRTLTLADMLVGATALHFGCSLATDNRKDFPVPELNLLPLP